MLVNVDVVTHASGPTGFDETAPTPANVDIVIRQGPFVDPHHAQPLTTCPYTAGLHPESAHLDTWGLLVSTT